MVPSYAVHCAFTGNFVVSSMRVFHGLSAGKTEHPPIDGTAPLTTPASFPPPPLLLVPPLLDPLPLLLPPPLLLAPPLLPPLLLPPSPPLPPAEPFDPPPQASTTTHAQPRTWIRIEAYLPEDQPSS
jgi:hypothetical protein